MGFDAFEINLDNFIYEDLLYQIYLNCIFLISLPERDPKVLIALEACIVSPRL